MSEGYLQSTIFLHSMKTLATTVFAIAAIISCTRNESQLLIERPTSLIPIQEVQLTSRWEDPYQPIVEVDSLGLLTPLDKRCVE